MSIYRSTEGARAIREQYLQWLQRWPVPNQPLRLPTGEGETFVLACGPQDAPPLVLLHGSHANAIAWINDAPLWSRHFRVLAVDLIGQPGLSAESRPRWHSDRYVRWLDEVLNALGVERAAMVGESLGGWLAADYASHHPDRVSHLALLVPGGIGRPKNFVLKALPFMFLGPWGAKKILEMVLGKQPSPQSDAARELGEFIGLIFKHYNTSYEKLPVLSDTALRRLTMPTLAILGTKDALLDSADTKHRLEYNVQRAHVRMLPEAGHLIVDRSAPILEFLVTPG